MQHSNSVYFLNFICEFIFPLFFKLNDLFIYLVFEVSLKGGVCQELVSGIDGIINISSACPTQLFNVYAHIWAGRGLRGAGSQAARVHGRE